MIRRPPRSTLSSSSAASDVYKRQVNQWFAHSRHVAHLVMERLDNAVVLARDIDSGFIALDLADLVEHGHCLTFLHVPPVSYTHLRAHETPEHLVCRLLLEKKKKQRTNNL
eukprot:TRINITY_DN4866_c0_g1_i2.p1 TRINITY_DN4866_c0_g1~~TRINITY_DN4866_c0_g1_i2.p1  ORF type:complete len:111 (-),score=25.25 TRINITY_DN4866_c0_g1_i2:109-441(-)